MDWCLNIYDEWRMAAYAGAGRTMKMLLIVLVFWLALFWSSIYMMPTAMRSDGDAISGCEAEVLTAEVISESIVIPEVSEVTVEKITSGTEAQKAEAAVSVVPENLSITDKMKVLKIPAVTETPVISDISALPETPAESETPIVPETPAVPEAPIVPETPIESETPAVPDSSENALSSSGTVGGFMVDENGFICGVADPELAISDGVMEFPSEGCCGISAGAFADGLASVLEVYIPGNITKIEQGAFTGLMNVEWYTAEPGSGFSDKMGVLLSDNGTTIFAFPCGRTGSYKVPEEITGFAQSAFADAGIESIDMTECAAEVPFDLPGYIEAIMR